MDDSAAGTSHAVTEDFDVFLNHRGPDVKATFVAHLEDALRCAGFHPFLDARSLMKGDPALKSIDQALDMAKVHVAVVSRGYAESKYCLNELVAMVKSGKPVVPVFYDVEPVDLRWVENGPFAEAFEKHNLKGRTQKRMQEWREALGALAGLTGFRLADYISDEAKLKREVVNEVARLIPSNEAVDVEEFRVGLEGPANMCIQMLENMDAGPGMLGLVEMGGIGKTTLARELYNHFAAQKRFKHMTFLEISRDSSSANAEVRPTQSRELRKQVLWDLLSVRGSTSSYSSWFQKVSTLGPVFIVVDDVHKLGQFEELIPFTSVLHPGSRIVVTSRDRGVLNNVAGRTKLCHRFFDVSTLNWNDSNLLFNWHAFQDEKAPEGYESVSEDVVKACGGLPLALKVIGSSLYDKRLDGDRETIWAEAKDALRQSTDLMGVLRWSYDNLPDSEKFMFMDITCLFLGKSVDEALAYWESCKECMSCDGVRTPHTSLRSLINKNLVVLTQGTYTRSSFRVHDLLKDLGQEIGMRSKRHFVSGRVGEAAITKNQGSKETMGLNLTGSRKRKFEAEDFTSMPNLHFLQLPDGSFVNGDFRFMPKELRVLQWRAMPLAHIPVGLDLSLLTKLDFSKSSSLAALWTKSNTSLEGFPNLHLLNLCGCTSITKLPDSLGQSIQVLWLGHCSKLKRLPQSIEKLKGLKVLDLVGCTSLKALPESIGALSNLERLHTYNCVSLTTLPISLGLLPRLNDLSIGGSIEGQPFSYGTCIGEAWTQLRRLTFNFGGLGSHLKYGALKCLKSFYLVDNVLTELSESFGQLICLEELIIHCERLQYLPKSVGDLKMLKALALSHCDDLKRLPENLGALTNLEWLEVNFCPIKRLPKSIGFLSQLLNLRMGVCKKLQKLPTSIRHLKSLQEFRLDSCGSIETMGVLTTLQGLPLWGSTSITKLPTSLGNVSTLAIYDNNMCMRLDYGSCPRLCDGCFEGTSQVLEEDQSGFLKACQDKSTRRTRLLRKPQPWNVIILNMNNFCTNVVIHC